MLIDYWAHRYADDPVAAENEAVDDDFDVDAEVARIDAEAEGIDDWEQI